MKAGTDKTNGFDLKLRVILGDLNVKLRLFITFCLLSQQKFRFILFKFCNFLRLNVNQIKLINSEIPRQAGQTFTILYSRIEL